MAFARYFPIMETNSQLQFINSLNWSQLGSFDFPSEEKETSGNWNTSGIKLFEKKIYDHDEIRHRFCKLAPKNGIFLGLESLPFSLQIVTNLAIGAEIY